MSRSPAELAREVRRFMLHHPVALAALAGLETQAEAGQPCRVCGNAQGWPSLYCSYPHPAAAPSPADQERGCAACDGDPEAHGLHVCGKEPFA